MRNWFAVALLGIAVVAASAQTLTTTALGSHDLSDWNSPIVGGLPACLFCHAPHNGVGGTAAGLWSQKLSTVTNYTLYSSATLVNTPKQPVLGSTSNLCLSCHDGTVAPGTTSPYGQISMNGSMLSQDVFGQDLSTVHPFNFQLPLQPAPNVLPSVTTNPGSTANPAVKLIDGNVQCNTCHEPHMQYLDSSNTFLVMDNTGSALCLACHVSAPGPSPITAKRTGGHNLTAADSAPSTESQATYNPLTGWSTSVHAQANHAMSKRFARASHGTVRRNGCMSCHTTHLSQAKGGLLVRADQVVPGNIDAVSQTCINCHNGGDYLSPALLNVFQEFSKKGAHPFPTPNNVHSSKERTLLDKNRHTTCVDCHEPHASQKTTSFASLTLRPSQNGVNGISAIDGSSLISPANYQYENCFRCHASGGGKQVLEQFGYLPTRLSDGGDALNLVPQFSKNAPSSHPVTHDRSSSGPQPSLLKAMLNLDGHTQSRIMGTRLLCTDCHNSDDNREFGGSGPNGPHGSQYDHLLERRYEMSRVASGIAPVAGPGTAIQNLLPVVIDPGANGPYSLCAKCHDLNNIMSNASFNKHATHIGAGFSCSVCHSAHGVPQATSGGSGTGLINFDIAVVAPNDAEADPIAYNRTNSTCTLKCHNYNHNRNGTVTPSSGTVVHKLNH